MTIYVWANTWDKAMIDAARGNYYFTTEKAIAEFKHGEVKKLWKIQFQEMVWK